MAAPVEKRLLTDLTETQFQVNADPGADRMIAADVACQTCGYNLRGLATTGRCPECDTPIDRSLHGNLLRYSDPRWVRTVARGMRVLNAAVALGLIAVIGLTFYRRAIGLPWLTMATALFVGIVAIIGVWLATVPEPAVAEREAMFSSRRLLRVLVIATVVLQAGGDLLATQWLAGTALVRTLAAIVLIAVILCAFRYAISLAKRLPDPMLVLQTRGVMWGVAASYGLSLLIAGLIMGGSNALPALTVVYSLSCTVMVACVVFTVWCLTLIGRYAKVLRNAAFEAEATWAGRESQI